MDNIDWSDKDLYKNSLSYYERDELRGLYNKWLNELNYPKDTYDIFDWCFVNGLLNLEQCRKLLR